MGRIHVLDDTLANQIAAGEVVERPASAAKELLENALDAGATAITVEVAGGGVDRLRVVDNGHGMSREDAQLALRRHATSKLRSAGDLSHILTLGFRGEALPSIASVSRFSLRTREADAVGATLVRVEGGAGPQVIDAAGPVGTEIVVEDLFFNVPARRKFLKKPETEAAHVQEAVQQLALCYPPVAFRFVKDGRVSLDLPRHESLLDRARAIFGAQATEALEPVGVGGALGLDGLVGSPEAARSTARHYHTFINGRYVRDRVIMSAVQTAYGQRLQRGKHPFVLLRLTLPPEAVDVNVHPAKTEVRFVDSSAIHRLVGRAIDEVLRADPWRAAAEAAPAPDRAYTIERAPEPPPEAPRESGLDAHRRRIFDVMERLTANRGSPQGVARRVPGPARPVAPATPKQPPPQLDLGVPAARPAPPPPAPVAVLGPSGRPPTLQLADLRVLGPLGADLLLCAATDGLVGIALEAARARVAFDRLARGAPGQPLAAPVTLELNPDEAARLDQRREALTGCGFEVEAFGGRTWAVKRVPAGLPLDDAAPALRGALDVAPDPAELRGFLARRAAALATTPTAEAPALLAALDAVTHEMPRPPAWRFTLTEDELRRRLTTPRTAP